MNNKDAKTTKLFVGLNLLFYFATLLVNYLGAAGFFNGMGQKEVSDKYMTLLTPAGFAFSIWGVIYTFIFISLVYLVMKRNDRVMSKVIRKISPLFIISCLLNMGWIIAFSYELVGISTVFILGIVISLLLIVEVIYKSRKEIPYTLLGISFTLYGAWVFIATILNSSIFLVQQNWGRFGVSESVWTIIMIIVAVVLTLSYLVLYKNAVFPISLAWAFFGIYSAYRSGQLEPPMAEVIQLALLVGIGVFIVAIIFVFIRNGYSIFPKESRKY